MTSLDRAKQFLQNKSKALASAAAPLAALVMLAIPAKATLTFNTPSCSGGRSGLTASSSFGCSGSTTPGPGNFANGLSLSGDVSGTDSSSGGTFGLSMEWSASTDGGTFSGSMPVDWNFTVTPSDTTDSYTWTLDFILGNGPSLSESGSSTGTTIFNASDAIPGINSSITSVLVAFSIQQFNAASGSTLDVNFPAGSTIDINPVPEPASLFLFVPGLGLLLARKRFKKNS